VWVARAGGPKADRTQLVRIDPHAGKVVGHPIRIPGAVPLDLVAGDGVWATDSGGALSPESGGHGGVTRVDPATGKVTGPPLKVGARPSAIALGEGDVWVTDEDAGTLTPLTR
jgi:streptogramin lyase